MTDLEIYAAIAEVFGGLAIFGGALFAIVQIRDVRRGRREQVAAELCRGFAAPHLARAVNLIRKIPDNASIATLREMDPEYEEAIQALAMTFETMGLLVHMNVASFKVVQDLTGGLLLMMYRKINLWIKETRVEQDNPRFGEWVQWLAERIAEQEAQMVPAYEAHSDWKPNRDHG